MSAAAKKAAPRVDLDATRERLLKLGLQEAAEALERRVSEAVKDSQSPHRFLDQLLDEELGSREERRVRTSLRLSNLPTGMTLGSFDFGFQPSIEKSRIETLATCAWIRERMSLLLQGPPGVGKTHLGVALGVRAIENGFSVAFYRLEELLAAMRRDADVSPSKLRRKKYLNVALLVIDEVGFEPMSRQEASLFFRLVSYWKRHPEKGPRGRLKRDHVPPHELGPPAVVPRALARTLRHPSQEDPGGDQDVSMG